MSKSQINEFLVYVSSYLLYIHINQTHHLSSVNNSSFWFTQSTYAASSENKEKGNYANSDCIPISCGNSKMLPSIDCQKILIIHWSKSHQLVQSQEVKAKNHCWSYLYWSWTFAVCRCVLFVLCRCSLLWQLQQTRLLKQQQQLLQPMTLRFSVYGFSVGEKNNWKDLR